MSKCNNAVRLKVTNERDKSAITGMLMLPIKTILDKLKERFKSVTSDFWD